MESTLHQEILNNTDINDLLKRNTVLELALVFQVPEDYIRKARRLQEARLILDMETNQQIDEMRISCAGSWMNSKERKYIKQFNHK